MTITPTAFPVPGENFIDREGELRGVTKVEKDADNAITVHYLGGDPEVYPPPSQSQSPYQRAAREARSAFVSPPPKNRCEPSGFGDCARCNGTGKDPDGRDGVTGFRFSVSWRNQEFGVARHSPLRGLMASGAASTEVSGWKSRRCHQGHLWKLKTRTSATTAAALY